MTSFTMQGHRGSDLIEITWKDGKLSGDPDAVEYVQQLATAYEGKLIATPADMTNHDHLENPYSAASLMSMAFSDRPVTIAGGVPPVAPPPEGAVM